MSENNQDTQRKNEPTHTKTLFERLIPFIKNWRWYLILILVTIFFVKIYLRYSIPIFKSQATILISEDERSGSNPQGIDILENLELVKSSSNLANEIEVMKAHSILGPVVDTLNLRVTAYLLGDKSGVRKEDLYRDIPFDIEIKKNKKSNELNTDNFEFSINLKILSPSLFSLNDDSKYSFEEEIKSFSSDFNVTFKPNSNFSSNWIGKTIELTYSTKESAINTLAGNLEIIKKNKESTVLSISTQGPNTERSNDILSHLIESYKRDALHDKNIVAANTSAFIKERMKFLLEELNDVEKSGESYKNENKIVDFQADVTDYMSNKGEASRLTTQAEIELSLIEILRDHLRKTEDLSVLLPANLGFQDGSINQMTDQYNKLVLDRSKLLQSSSNLNPLVQKTETQIYALKESLEKGLKNLKSSVTLRLNSYKKKYTYFNSELAQVPKLEREYRSILRQQQIKETLYLYLLQKREENEIELAASVSNIKTIEPAHNTGIQIFPKPSNYYMLGFFLAILLPTVIIYILQLLDTKVRGSGDIVGLTLIGQIPKSDDDRKIILQDDRTYLSEAFRMLRANISFFLNDSERKAHVIAISSTLPNEGKTFTSVNLSHSLSNIGHEVVILGLDLRVPKLSDYFIMDKKTGISNYIVDSKLTVEDIIQKDSENENLYYINAGDIPPNPSELLMKPRFFELIELLKERFTFIILDTSPIGLIADCLPVIKNVDLLIYVVRCEFLDRNLLNVPKDYIEDGVISNCAIVLNYVEPLEKRYGYSYRYGYRYKYGYGYKNGYFSNGKKKSLWVKLFSRKKKTKS
jgi:capsular exopolysaccharide synthesis family protein